jgi:hypothetical protein
MKKFIEESLKIQKLLGLSPIKPNYTNITYNRYISTNTKSLTVLKTAIDKPKNEVLAVAPTGAGKTYSINLLFEAINTLRDTIINEFTTNSSVLGGDLTPEKAIKYFLSKEKKNINILLCPNKIQNLQNESKYDMIALVSKSKGLYAYDLDKNNNFSAVYEKAGEIKEYLEDVCTREDVKINLIVDEAHKLVEESNFAFRGKCLMMLESLIQTVLDLNGSVIYITATPDSLKCKPFNEIIEFFDKSYKAPAKKLDIICNATYQNMSDFCHKHINESTLPFFRLNSFNITNNILHSSDILEGKTILTVDGKRKDYTTIRDIYGVEHTIYSSELFGEIVENGNLPITTKIEGKDVKVDGYGATSVLEVGSNINSIGGKQDSSLTPIYICQDRNNMSISSIIQFFNRVRFSVDKYVLLLPNYEDIELTPLEDIVKAELKKKATYINSYNQMIKAYKSIAVDEEDLISTVLKFLNNDTRKDGSSSDLGYLYLDKETLEVKAFMYSFWNVCYSKYISQYYFNTEALATELRNKLKIQVNVIKDFDVKDFSTQTINKAKEYFNDVVVTPDIENQVLSNKITDKDLLKYSSLSLYKDALELINLGESVEGAFRDIGSLTRVNLSKLKTNLLKMKINKMKPSEINAMIDVICHITDISDIADEDLKEKIALISNHTAIKKYIKSMKELDIDNKKIIKKLLTAKTDADLTKISYKALAVIHNNNYVNDKKYMLVGGSGTEVRIVLDALYKLNESNNLIQKTIDLETLSSIRDTLQEELACKYTTKDVMDIIKCCFLIKTDKDKEGITTATKIYKLRLK